MKKHYKYSANIIMFFFISLALFGTYAIGVPEALAQTGGQDGPGFTLPNPLDCETFEECIFNVLRALTVFATPLYVLMIIIAGFYFVVSGGDKEKITRAKNILKYSTIGFLIIIFSWAIMSAVRGIL